MGLERQEHGRLGKVKQTKHLRIASFGIHSEQPRNLDLDSILLDDLLWDGHLRDST